ncbi:hypothetical protein AB2M62_10215 [Sphingomonas sp. MMS12-HWE2-04]|uniref:hypothetical protein n=1 Tax=Sphingomonas sp. MMS12-HWE2-04 TaxID=3234199 RepID=UPI00384AF9D5
MGNSKPLASLSSGLLARKGQARPAMRPQGFVGMTAGASLDDLGWNDMGEAAHAQQFVPAPSPVIAPVEDMGSLLATKPAVLRQREVLDEQIARVEPEPVAEVAPQPAPVSTPVVTALPEHALKRVVAQVAAKKSKAAFTLRLDPERHLKLRLASAVTGRSAQQIVTTALDAFLESIGEVDALARQIATAKDNG